MRLLANLKLLTDAEYIQEEVARRQTIRYCLACKFFNAIPRCLLAHGSKDTFLLTPLAMIASWIAG